jgi:hypothetical protein
MQLEEGENNQRTGRSRRGQRATQQATQEVTEIESDEEGEMQHHPVAVNEFEGIDDSEKRREMVRLKYRAILNRLYGTLSL